MPKKKVKTKRNTKRKTTKLTKKEIEENNSLIRIIGNIIALFFSVFIAISNFSMGGPIGDIVRNVVMSLFGTLGYLFPIILVLAIIISYTDKGRISNIKCHALLILYVMVICIAESYIMDFNIDAEFPDVINESLIRARNIFSFDEKYFSAGVIGTSITYISFKSIGILASKILYGSISLITLLLIFGLGLTKNVTNIFKAIFMIVPNIIDGIRIKREEDRQIAIDNENILRKTIENSKKVNLKGTYENSYRSDRIVLDPIPYKEKRKFDTSNVNISAEDIQSRFFRASDNDNSKSNQSRLLNELKTKSINEIIFEEKQKGNEVNPFFYTDKMKPVDELENIKFDNNINKFNNANDVQDDEYIYNDDSKNFASGLSELREDKNINDMSSKEVLSNIGNMDIEVKNQSIKNDDIITTSRKKKPAKYKFPPLTLLHRTEKKNNSVDHDLNNKSEILVETLKQFGVGVTVTNITVGPSITRFELKPDIGVKISKILSLENDVKLALAASEIRIEAPIPGKSAIGIEIPNAKSSGVMLGDIISSSEFRNSTSKLTVAIGKDISGQPIITDLRMMPHLLIAGATGSGKSVCVNSLITSLIYKSRPEDVRMIMIDPKVVELQIYNGIPHLLIPVVTNPKKAAGALNWAVSEMTRRYNLIQEKKVRDIESYNQIISGEIKKISVNEDNEADLEPVEKLPYIVIIIDEFADLMMIASKDVENAISRIAQLARACGIYLVIATQRPSVNVISGIIKANVPSRISFAVSSSIDSRTILDRNGAEKLLGRGDMLYFPKGIPEPIRVQGCYVSEEEILDIVSFVKDDNIVYDELAEKTINSATLGDGNSSYGSDEKDDMFVEAGKLIIDQQNASIGMLQRRFRMGFNRAARIIDQLEAEGVISKQDGKKPREVLMSIQEFTDKFGG